MKKIISRTALFLFVALLLTGCSDKTEKKSNKSPKETSTVEKTSVAYSDVLDEKQAVDIVKNKWDEMGFQYESLNIQVSNITKYKEGYLFVMRYPVDGACEDLYYVTFQKIRTKKTLA